MRLNRYLSLCGIASRRKADLLIRKGEIFVNGLVCRDFSFSVCEKKDEIFYKGEKLFIDKYYYYAFYKPAGYLSTIHDPLGRPIIYDLLSDIKVKVFNVGRLDYQSEGLLLLTNDGKLAYRLLHPRYRVSKDYYVKVNSFIRGSDVFRLTNGIPLKEGIARAFNVRIISNFNNLCVLSLTLRQGMKRQIRRMFEMMNIDVVYLRRDSFASISLQKIQKGSFRSLQLNEIFKLKGQVNL